MGNTIQHDERGCPTDAAVAVAGPWVAIQDAVVQVMGSRPNIGTGTDAE